REVAAAANQRAARREHATAALSTCSEHGCRPRFFVLVQVKRSVRFLHFLCAVRQGPVQDAPSSQLTMASRLLGKDEQAHPPEKVRRPKVLVADDDLDA